MPAEGRATVFYPPPLSPQFCFSTSTLKEFLRFSRSTIDDTITQNLNALNAPAKAGFPPSSTSQRNVYPPRHILPFDACRDFTSNVLFPSWQNRADVLNYCASVATSDDPGDPDTLTRLAETEAHREKVVDERLDPYSGRWFPREPRTEILASIVRNERRVEEIIRERTWRIMGERCGGLEPLGGQDWREAFEKWRAGRVVGNRSPAPPHHGLIGV
ncbi:caffeine-induced death protein 2-domain-containing protein [Terfezia claveryi]|nr:caffeine-induced death protein 2-domain-containing protein [Terfezia claveryi]